MSSPAIQVDCLFKKYCLDLKKSFLYGAKDLTNTILPFLPAKDKLRSHEFWALNDVSFDLKKGQTLGLVGSNGAGKSTLLKIINGLIYPTKGSITVNGRVGALIQLGVGFNPHLTGRENIYINAAILGLNRKEINYFIDSIIDFAEIGEFIDSPLKNYSNGMKVRLGYAITTKISPDIMLIDEVLSVGDASFREKCMHHLSQFKKKGGATLFVSHNSSAIETFCDEALWLNKGQLVKQAGTKEVIYNYETESLKIAKNIKNITIDRHKKSSTITCNILNESGKQISEIAFAEPFSICTTYDFLIKPKSILIEINRSYTNQLYIVSQLNYDLSDKIKGEQISCKIMEQTLSPGNYLVRSTFLDDNNQDCGQAEKMFSVLPGKLSSQLPAVPSSHLMTTLPPIVNNSSFKINEKEYKIIDLKAP